MILPGLIATVIIGGWLTILPFLLMVVLCTLLAIFLINAVYLLILKITTPTKFQSIITYIQIIFAVIVYGGYQLFPRLLQRAQLDNWKIADHWQASFLPSPVTVVRSLRYWCLRQRSRHRSSPPCYLSPSPGADPQYWIHCRLPPQQLRSS